LYMNADEGCKAGSDELKHGKLNEHPPNKGMKGISTNVRRVAVGSASGAPVEELSESTPSDKVASLRLGTLPIKAGSRLDTLPPKAGTQLGTLSLKAGIVLGTQRLTRVETSEALHELGSPALEGKQV
jgi:hypothetical protein